MALDTALGGDIQGSRQVNCCWMVKSLKIGRPSASERLRNKVRVQRLGKVISLALGLKKKFPRTSDKMVELLIFNVYIVEQLTMNTLDKESLEKLSNSITSVFNADGIEILFTNAELKYNIGYWTHGKTTLSLFLDGKKCQVKGTKVTYKCSCGRINTILLKKFLRKTKLACVHCAETREKSEWHSKVMQAKKNGIDLTHKKIATCYDFDIETDEFKDAYWKYSQNLTVEEFNKVLKYIYSIDGVVLDSIRNIEYLPTEPCKNQKKYTPMVSMDGVKHCFKNIYLKCPFCGKIFRISRGFKQRILDHNFDCLECRFVNKSFALRKYNEELLYQSNKELEFIEKCVKLGIAIKNGPRIPYFFNNSKHNYRIDFEIPSLKEMIEIKDMHIWHKNQLKSGKWQAKENAAIEYCEQIGYTYKLLFPNDFDDFFNAIERDSLSNSESC